MTNRTQTPQFPLMATVNELMDELHRSLGLPDSDFFCECADIGCRERITLTRDGFARLRSESRLAVVAAHAHRIGDTPAEVLELRGEVRRELLETLHSQ